MGLLGDGRIPVHVFSRFQQTLMPRQSVLKGVPEAVEEILRH